jgi:hypothetical protein
MAFVQVIICQAIACLEERFYLFAFLGSVELVLPGNYSFGRWGQLLVNSGQKTPAGREMNHRPVSL